MTSPPALRDVPSTLHTPRLLMRCPQPGDGALVHAAVVDTLAALRQFPASLPWALPDDANLASSRVCERAGYALEGMLRHERADPDGQLRHTRVYAITG